MTDTPIPVTEEDYASYTGSNLKTPFRTTFSSFRLWLFTAMVFVSAMPILGLTIWLERSAVEKEFEAVEQKHLIVAQNLSMALSRYVMDIESFIRSRAEELEAGDRVRLTEAALNDLDIVYVTVLDRYNQIIPEQSQQGGNILLPEQGLIGELRQLADASSGKVAFSGIEKLNGKPHFYVVRKLSDDRLLLAPLSPRYVDQVQKSIAFGVRGHAMIVDARGKVVAHPNPQWQADSKDASKISIVQKMMARETGVAEFYSPPMKADMIAGFTFVPQTGWGVMVPQPTEELVLHAREVQLAGILFGAVEILLAIVVSWWLSSILSNPVSQLVATAKKVSAGNLKARTGFAIQHAPVELRALGNELDSMVDELDQQSAKLSTALAKAEAGSKAKSQFMAMMSHEIRTPVTGVMGLLDILEETRLESDQRGYIDLSRATVNGLLNIVNDILDFSRLDAGTLRIQSTPFDLHALLDEVSSLFLPAAKAKALDLTCEHDERLPEIVTGDLQRTRQILFNIVGNAIKFTDSGSVTVNTRYDPTGPVTGMLTFSVTDTGIGIPKETEDRIFEEFSQGDNSYSRQHEGSGLGLAISRRLVMLMNGEINYESKQGVGTRFNVTIPVKVEQHGND